MEPEFITIKEAGRRFFGVSEPTARRMADEGKIPTVSTGRQRKVDVGQMREHYQRMRNGDRVQDTVIARIVRENIGTIELALLTLAIIDVPNHKIDPRSTAGLASSLRNAVNVQTS